MELADLLLDPWRSGLGRSALAEMVLLAALCGPLGFWVVTYGLTYAGESLAHGLLPGLVLAAIAGVPLLVGAAGGALVAAAAVAGAGRDERIGPDAATGVAVTGLLGLGGLLAFVPDRPQRVGELLFGDPLAAGAGDIAAAAALLVLGALALAALHRPLMTVALDPVGARTLGARPALVSLGLLILLAAATVVAVRGLGSLLVLALLVAPALAVRRHASSPAEAMLAAAAVAVTAAVTGLYVSHHAETAAGASVALALCAAAALGAMWPPRGAARRGAR